MDKTKRYLSVAFVAVLAIVIVVSLIGMILLKKKPVILQGQIEATEIRISGKLPGRIEELEIAFEWIRDTMDYLLSKGTP